MVEEAAVPALAVLALVMRVHAVHALMLFAPGADIYSYTAKPTGSLSSSGPHFLAVVEVAAFPAHAAFSLYDGQHVRVGSGIKSLILREACGSVGI